MNFCHFFMVVSVDHEKCNIVLVEFHNSLFFDCVFIYVQVGQFWFELELNVLMLDFLIANLVEINEGLIRNERSKDIAIVTDCLETTLKLGVENFFQA